MVTNAPDDLGTSVDKTSPEIPGVGTRTNVLADMLLDRCADTVSRDAATSQ
jgi:hypothetical protein